MSSKITLNSSDQKYWLSDPRRGDGTVQEDSQELGPDFDNRDRERFPF